MDESGPRDREFWPAVALEASLFFSFPAWFATANVAWPAANSNQFFRALVTGATAAFVLCHIAAAFWGQDAASTPQNSTTRLIGWIVSVWLCAGATFSLGETARLGGATLRVYHQGYPEYAGWNAVSIAVMVLYAMAAVAVAMSGLVWRRIAGFLCCSIGICLLSGIFVAQSPVLWTRNPYMCGEPKGDPKGLIEAILIVAAPAAVMAFRIGRMGVTTRRIWYSGILGVLLPIIAATTLASLTQMSGARLYWRPSLSIGFEYAMSGWRDVRVIQVVWALAGLAVLGPCILCAMWLAQVTVQMGLEVETVVGFGRCWKLCVDDGTAE